MSAPKSPPGNALFISCASDEFERPQAPFPGLRGHLRRYLARAGCEVKVQEDFPQADETTLRMLDGYIRRCAAVIHLVGGNAGAVASRNAVAAYLAAEPAFLQRHPELRAALDDGADLTYTQWEAFIALHHGVPLRVYATEKGAGQQAAHLERLKGAGRHAARIQDGADLLGQLIGDLHTILPRIPKLDRQLAPSRILRHAPRQLFGREAWLDALDAAWGEPERVNVYALIAWGGAGKTSVVAHWVAQRLAARQWPGVERYFDWSFYSQGAREHSQASADLFIAEALEFFGDQDAQAGSPWDRGERLAGLVRQHRTLLVLDGIEPLQYPPNSPQAGEFKDQALAALLQGLAMDNPGLCVVTSRETLKSLQAFSGEGGKVEERQLERLHLEAAIALLRHLQVVGSEEELEAAWRDVGGHALTLQLLGRFLAQAFPDRDIRHRREVRLVEADRETPGRTAMKVLLAYEKWLESAGPERQRDLAVLRLTGLFDRPASADRLAALRAAPAILGLTEAIVPLTDIQWRLALKDLEALELITQASDGGPGSPVSMDAHPLVREYFAKQLREQQPEAWREAHSRLFDHLCRSPPHRPDTLAGLQPLYQAVMHGCLAGRHEEARANVYRDRILRGTGSDGFYSWKALGAIGADLGAVAAFFEEPWSRLSPKLSTPSQHWLLNEAALRLRALGRLTEAVEPMRMSLKMCETLANWREAAVRANNLSELGLALGKLGEAVADGRRAIDFAERSGDGFLKLAIPTTAADELHQAGEQVEARALFSEAERLQAESQPTCPLLNSVQGFRYADLILAPAERAAWAKIARQGEKGRPPLDDNAEAERRAAQSSMIAERNHWLLDIALDHLTLARAQLYRLLLEGNTADPTTAQTTYTAVQAALGKLREANSLDHLPKALLTAALHAAAVAGDPTSAHRHLDEAQRIAERGPMPLYLADVHLHRARLFRDRAALAEARKLIEAHGYWRRREELEDAEAALLSPGQP